MAPGSYAGQAPESSEVSIEVHPGSGELAAVPCGEQVLDIEMTNETDRALFSDAYVSAQGPLHVSRPAVSSYLPAGYTLTAAVRVSVTGDADPGTYTVAVSAGGDTVRVPITVRELDGDNLARAGTPTASSTHGGWSACGAVDGSRDQSDWGGPSTTGWVDGTKNNWPDWYQVSFDQGEQVGSVKLTTISRANKPASEAGIRDWDVQVRRDGAWETVATVRDNEQGTVRSTFSAVETGAVRILIRSSNHPKYSAIVELEIYAGQGGRHG